MKKLGIFFLILLNINLTWSSTLNFYANKELQAKYPEAFSTNPSAVSFHQMLENTGQKERDLLVQQIQENPKLFSNILNFNALTTEKQIEVLEDLFLIECRVLNITAPELIIDEYSIPGYAFFEFDFKIGGPGKVFINKKKLIEEKNKSDFIILLIHETRHSAQFQMAQRPYQDALSKGFKSSFIAQAELKEFGNKLSFCDFMSLLNEFEAFQFANYIYGSLTNWQTPINDMGTLASQYDERGSLRLNLLDILIQTQQDPIELFNQLEIIQYQILFE